MKKILHFFGLETREEIMEFKAKRASRPFNKLYEMVVELEKRVKQLEDEKLQNHV